MAETTEQTAQPQPRVGDVARERCLNHELREAVARCPECRRFFCRECVTEHEDRVICAACLRKLAAEPVRRRRSFRGLFMIAQLAVTVLALWFAFYFVGYLLTLIPTDVHDATLWRDQPFEDYGPN